MHHVAGCTWNRFHSISQDKSSSIASWKLGNGINLDIWDRIGVRAASVDQSWGRDGCLGVLVCAIDLS